MKMTGKTQGELDQEKTVNDEISRKTQIRNALREESDGLYFEYAAGEITKQEWLDKRIEIKTRFPK